MREFSYAHHFTALCFIETKEEAVMSWNAGLRNLLK